MKKKSFVITSFFQTQNAPKPISALDPAGGAYDAPQTPKLADEHWHSQRGHRGLAHPGAGA